MPSSHAVALSYLTWMGCVGLGRVQPNAVLRSVWQWMLVLLSLYLTQLRVRFGHHTAAQVVVGYGFGWSCAVLCLLMSDGFLFSMGSCGDDSDSRTPSARSWAWWRVGSALVVSVSVWHVLRRSSVVRRLRAKTRKS